MTAIDTFTNKVIATSPVGQAPQAIAYVPNAVPDGEGTQNLQPLGIAGEVVHLGLSAPNADKALTSVSLFDQGLTQVLQAAVTGLEPKQTYVLSLASHADGSGALEPLAKFVPNPAGSAIVNATGPIRQVVQGEQDNIQRRYLVIAKGGSDKPGSVVQIQMR